jgi:hypothetical protein
MLNRLKVNVEAKNLSVIPGETVQTTVTISNASDTINQYTIRVEGLDPDWYSLSISSAVLFPNDEDKLTLTFHPPGTEKVKSGLYDCHLLINCQEHPENSADIVLALEIKEIFDCNLEINPVQIIGRRGHYRITARNQSESIVTFQLEDTEHDPILQCCFFPENLSIPAGGSAESTLDVKLDWWHFLRRKRQYNFTVVAREIGSNQFKTVSGQLFKAPVRIGFLTRFLKMLRRRQVPTITRFEAIKETNRRYTLIWAVQKAKDIKLDDVKVGFQGDLKLSPIEKVSYILTASNKHGIIKQTVTIEPPPLPKKRYSNRILAVIEPNVLIIAAGIEQKVATLEVQNIGTIVDKFSIEIEGLAENWYSIPAPLVAIMPNTKEQARIFFHPPKTSGVISGNYPFAVTLRSQSIPEDSSCIIGQLEILPSIDYSIDIKPYRSLCRGNCTFQILISNKNVSEANLFFDVTDLDNGLRYKLENESPVIRPWQKISVPMLVKPKRNSIIGDLKRYDISVTAKTDTGQTQIARCQLDHKPWLSSWRLIVRTIKYIVVIGIIGLAVYYIIRVGGGWGSLVRDPQTWVDGIIRHFRGWFY